MKELLKKSLSSFRITINDVLVMMGYFVLPEIMHKIFGITQDFRIMHYYLGLFSMLLFPLFCVAMVQCAAIDMRLRDGLEFLSRHLWTFFTWPLGIIFFVSLLFHGGWMWMGIFWGQFVYGDNFFEMLFPGQGYDVWHDPMVVGTYILQYGIAVWLVKRLWNISLKEYFPKSAVGWIIFFITLLPLYIVIGVSLIFVLPPYLMAISWGYLLARASSFEKPIIKPIVSNDKTRFFVHAIVLIYGVLMGYFFETVIGIIQQASLSEIPFKWASLTIFFFVFYLPYRMFSALGNRKSILGWSVFLLSVVMVALDLYRKF